MRARASTTACSELHCATACMGELWARTARLDSDDHLHSSSSACDHAFIWKTSKGDWVETRGMAVCHYAASYRIWSRTRYCKTSKDAFPLEIGQVSARGRTNSRRLRRSPHNRNMKQTMSLFLKCFARPFCPASSPSSERIERHQTAA